MKVGILGSGPAGLLAALATEQSGHEPYIIAKGDKSPMFGAMYLHEPIPGLTGDLMAPDFEIDVVKSGTSYGYAENVYGDPNHPCSWNDIPGGITPAWDLHKAYNTLWDRYESKILRRELDGLNLINLMMATTFDVVLCTIPAPAICRNPEHFFKQQEIWVIHGPGHALIKGVNDDNIMYYNGTTPEDGGFDWYRFSQINQYQAWEHSKEPFFDDWQKEIGRTLSWGKKPIDNDCDCWNSIVPFHRLGRFGKWKKGVLTHHAYRETMDILRGDLVAL